MEKKDFRAIKDLESWSNGRFKNRSVKILEDLKLFAFQYLMMCPL